MAKRGVGAAVLAIASGLLLAACESGEEVSGDTPELVSISPTTMDPAATSPQIERRCHTVAPEPGLIGAHAGLIDITTSSRLDVLLTGMKGHAVAVGDTNDDGFADVFVGGFADRPKETYLERGADGPAPDRLLLGSADGFRLDEEFPERFGRTTGAAFADLDNDGDLDLVVARNPRSGERSAAPSEVLENRAGRFTVASELDATSGARSIGLLDFDADSRLDVFLTVDRWSGGASRLLRNEGSFRFTDATDESGLPGDLHGLGVLAVDIDSSSTADLFVSGADRLFVNRGGRFVEVSGPFAWTRFGDEDDPGGVAAGDVNGDGQLDFVVGQHFNSTAEPGTDVPVRLFVNRGNREGDPQFDDVTAEAGLVGLDTKAPHVELIDFDGDGLVDLVASSSTTSGGPALFRNEGGDPPKFSFSADSNDGHYWPSGAVFRAGTLPGLQMILVEWEPAQSTRLFSLPNDGGAWIDVRVRQSQGDPSSIGTLIDVYGDIDIPGSRLATTPIVGSRGYGAGVAASAIVGVGQRSSVDIRARLPAGQHPREIVLRDVPAGSLVELSRRICD